MGFARHNLYYFSGRLLTAAISLVALVVFTRILSPEDYGRFSVMIAFSSLIASVAFQWLRQCLVQFGNDEHARAQLLGSISVLFLTLTIFVILLAFAVGWLAEINVLDLGVTGVGTSIGVVLFLAFAQSAFEFSADAARVDFQPLMYAISNAARAATSLILGAAGALLTGKLTITLFGFALGYAIPGYFAAPPWLRGLFSLRFASWRQIKALSNYGLPLSLTLGMSFILDSLDRLMLASMRDATTAGTYSSAYNLAQFSIGTVLSGLGLAVLPLAASAFRRNELALTKKLIERTILGLLAIGLPSAVGLAFEASSIGSLLLGNYQPAQSGLVIAIVAVASLLAGVRAYGYDLIFMVHRRTRIQAAILACAAAMNVLLNFLFIPAAGTTGAAWATLVALFFALVISVMVGRQIMKLDHLVVDIAKICLATLVMGLVLYVLPANQSWTSVVEHVAFGAAAYVGTIYLLNPTAARALLRSMFLGEQ